MSRKAIYLALITVALLTATTAFADVDVAASATGGTGADATNAWTGWDNRTWNANTTYRFKSGWYAFSSTLNLAAQDIEIVGEKGAILNFTGSGEAVQFVSPNASNGGVTFNVKMRNIQIRGNSNCTVGLHLVGLYGAIFENVVVNTATSKAIWIQHVVRSTFTQVHVPSSGYVIQAADDGFVLDYIGNANYQTIENTFIGCYVQSTIVNGFVLKAAVSNTFINVVSEGMPTSLLGYASHEAVADSDVNANTFINWHAEGNSSYGVRWRGRFCTFIDGNIQGTSVIENNLHASHNTLRGGRWENLSLGAYSSHNYLDNVKITGTFSDVGDRNSYFGLKDLNGGTITNSKLSEYIMKLDAVVSSAAAIAANSTDELQVTVTGLKTGDVVMVNKPSLQQGLAVGSARVSANDTLKITFINTTGAAITPANETYKVIAIRSN